MPLIIHGPLHFTPNGDQFPPYYMLLPVAFLCPIPEPAHSFDYLPAIGIWSCQFVHFLENKHCSVYSVVEPQLNT
jgi:hypothetical protein